MTLGLVSSITSHSNKIDGLELSLRDYRGRGGGGRGVAKVIYYSDNSLVTTKSSTLNAYRHLITNDISYVYHVHVQLSLSTSVL